MVSKKNCIYCGTKTYCVPAICPNCQEKLKLVRRILSWGVEMKLQAGKRA